MPRDGSGVYSTPPGTHGTPNTTILSANYNSNVDDVAADLNTPRPIVAGGTGATTAAGALTALGAVAKAGDTMTGPLTVTGLVQGTDVVSTGSVQARGGTMYLLSAPSGDANFLLADEAFTNKGALIWSRTANTVILRNNSASSGINFPPSGVIQLSNGIASRAGTAGGYSVDAYNFYWDGTGLNGFANATSLGYVQWSSDYRIKKDVVDLASTWEQVKTLRPIRYTQAQFSPPSHVEYVAELRSKDAKADDIPGHLYTADDIERWGFIAHELQATLTPSAATGEKDSPDTIQSPNPFTLIAALTKALQEAMVRIEALEAA